MKRFLYSQETQLNGNNYLLKNTKVNHICVTIFLYLYREYIYCVSFNCQNLVQQTSKCQVHYPVRRWVGIEWHCDVKIWKETESKIILLNAF